MKKRNCRMTSEEREQHEYATKIRKMTDQQIVQFIDDLQYNAENAGKMKDVESFFDSLSRLPISGIGKATVAKLREFAVYAGFIS